MSDHSTTRRDLIAIAGTMGVGLLATTVGAQERVKLSSNVRGRDAREEHQRRIAETLQILKGRPPLSLEGLSMLVDFLVEIKVIEKADGELLKKVLRAIFESKEVARLVSTVDAIYKELTDKVGDVAVAIIGIARDSVEWVNKAGASITIESAIRIVASDISGALSGAATGAKLGGKPLAVICAIAGAVATSANAVLEPKR